ncbi:MAG: cell division ATP-binding protein FtsE [Oscillatoriales cyanobacterium SM2_1_8]|nr:cell division ATP-binding protein FtsE [Oscillatoriales cyanobacterium SM2_1_8]
MCGSLGSVKGSGWDDTSAAVQLWAVSKTYGNGATGLRDVTLEVFAGEFVFVTGHSGSGKSTLLKLLYGAERPTAGRVMVGGHAVPDLDVVGLARLRRHLGLVFQDGKLIPQRTVAENAALALKTRGYGRREIERRLAAALKLVGLQTKAHCFPAQLSGGEQQRAGIARAVVHTPQLLLADEPTGNLDPDNAWQVVQIFKKLHALGTTVVVSTHDETLVRAAKHRVIRLQGGAIAGAAAPLSVSAL